MTDMEQIQALVEAGKAGDIYELAEQRKRQMTLGNQLRGQMQHIKGNRVTPNIARALYGLSGAYNDYQAAAASPQITAGKQKLLEIMLRNRQAAGEPGNPMDSGSGQGIDY